MTIPLSRRCIAPLALLALVAPATAPAVAAPSAPSATGFSLAPGRGPAATLLKGRPGETLSSSVRVLNRSHRTKTIHLQVADIDTASSTGVSYATTHPHRAGTWVHLDRHTIKVPAGTSTRVAFTVGVPQDVRGGAHYAGVVATDAAQMRGPRATRPATGKRSFEVRRVVRMAIPVTISLPGPRTRNVVYSGATLNTDTGAPELRLALRNTGTLLIDGARISLRAERDGRSIFTYKAAMAQVMPDGGFGYSVPWTGAAKEGDYRLVGTIKPKGAKAVFINDVIHVTGKQAKKAAKLQPPVATQKSAIPMIVWIALGAAGALITGMAAMIIGMRRRMDNRN
jgi:hypothetical protein